MAPNNPGNSKAATILHTGAERGSNPSKTEQVQHGTQEIGAYRLHFDMEKVKQLSSKVVGTSITEIFSADKHEIESKWMEGKPVVIINYRSYTHQNAAMEKNPELLNCIYKRDENMEGNDADSGTTLKVRQYPIDTDVADLLAMNGLEKWRGHMYAPKTEKSKKTSAFLRAPSKEVAEKLLEQGYLLDNGKVLGVVPSNSTPAEEDERTVLLLGTNKVSKAMWNRGESLSEQALLTALNKANYPVQAYIL